jgi:NADPH2:quinone reductase
VKAAWYDRKGPAAEVLQVGELADPSPGPGEVRVRLSYSGVNPGDIKKREGWLGFPMSYPRIIPHSDGSGIIDAVGQGVDAARVGRRVWVYGAQSYRPFGTAAAMTVVPDARAVDLPPGVSDHLAATLGIPGITAHRAVFADGSVDRQVVLIHGVLGAVGSLAAALAAWGGATVIGTVRRAADLDHIDRDGVRHVVALDQSDVVAQIHAEAPDGVDRIIEVALSANADFDAQVVRQGAIIAAYSSPDERPQIPFWPLLFANVTLRLLGSDDFPAEAKDQAARDLSAVAAEGLLSVRIAPPYPLDRVADAHEAVEAGSPDGRVLVAL